MLKEMMALSRISNIIITDNYGCTTVTLEARDDDGNYIIKEIREVLEISTTRKCNRGNMQEKTVYCLGIVNSTER